MHIPASSTASGLSWVARPGDERAVAALAQQQDMNELLARVLIGRGVAIDDAARFLQPTLRECLPDPFHLKDMDKAVARLLRAIEAKENIAVFGDYDVDGATSTALLVRYFAALGIRLATYIPDRLKEGYGPSIAAFDTLIDGGAKLIITVDCGTLAHEPIAHAQGRDVDVIVLDHHLGSAEMPKAHALVNPNRADESSPHRSLAAVGVTFLLLVALSRALREAGYFGETRREPDLLPLLDLVALGTVCDVMPLTGLNRAFVAQGLKVLRARGHKGLAALADVAQLAEVPSAYHLGFLLGPRINAGGRVGESALGVALLTGEDEGELRDIAARLDHFNRERRAIEDSMLEAALAQAQQQANAPVIVVAQRGWHAGVIGIVAARLKEKFSRPAAVIALEGGLGKGSARSVTGADMGAAIHAAQLCGILDAGGGHAMAAGFSLREEQVSALHRFLIERLSPAVAAYQEARALTLDGWLSAGGASLQLLDSLAAAAPHGIGNPSPRFGLKAARILQRQVLKGKHIRCILGDDAGTGRLSAIAFNVADTPLGAWLMSERVLHLAGELKREHWQGAESARFIIEDAAKPLAA
ncbi:MAG: single-stranded-DNA-specific exonuclease RecJ [Alphaproteobacteria bacterium]